MPVYQRAKLLHINWPDSDRYVIEVPISDGETVRAANVTIVSKPARRMSDLEILVALVFRGVELPRRGNELASNDALLVMKTTVLEFRFVGDQEPFDLDEQYLSSVAMARADPWGAPPSFSSSHIAHLVWKARW